MLNEMNNLLIAWNPSDSLIVIADLCSCHDEHKTLDVSTLLLESNTPTATLSEASSTDLHIQKKTYTHSGTSFPQFLLLGWPIFIHGEAGR